MTNELSVKHVYLIELQFQLLQAIHGCCIESSGSTYERIAKGLRRWLHKEGFEQLLRYAHCLACLLR